MVKIIDFLRLKPSVINLYFDGLVVTILPSSRKGRREKQNSTPVILMYIFRPQR